MSIDTSCNYWFVGASRGGNVDKTDELIEQGIWRFWPPPDGSNPYESKIRSMQPGDRIAIKAAYTRKHDLPFENRGNPVSVMSVKAIGEIVENPGDGLQVRVDWKERFDPPKEWFFYTGRFSVWKMKKDDWAARGLVRFAFHDEPQDIERFLRHPFWQYRYGIAAESDTRFGWAALYQALADRLRDFRSRRGELVEKLEALTRSNKHLNYLYDPAPDGGRQFISDIDPFTILGAFNRNLGLENRRVMAADIARMVGVDMDVPESFDGVPMISQMRSKFFFRPEDGGRPEHIETLWEIFATALDWSETEDDVALNEKLAELYTRVLDQPGIAWMLSMGLFWIRPWDFVPLDRNSRDYLARKFDIEIPRHNGSQRLNGPAYLELIGALRERFEEDDCPVRSFPELSYKAWMERGEVEVRDAVMDADDVETDGSVEMPEYGLDDIAADGCFFAPDELEAILRRLERRKNIILQGPPGTGKTWMSKKLAYAWIGHRDDRQVTAVQFHPTLSYEDFVRGWRPSGDGRLVLADGPLMQAVFDAKNHPDQRFVVVIEEINRGNPAQIFGEMLTLIEGDKRKPDYALRLSHMHENEAPVFLPPNLYLIGTMNIADRSLALVDLALRRRFAFIDLEPQLNSYWANWLEAKGQVAHELVDEIAGRIRRLNDVIADDGALGPQFRVGHSYVTPAAGEPIANPRNWFKGVVETEIGPLLEEYWFDRPERAREERERLLAGW